MLTVLGLVVSLMVFTLLCMRFGFYRTVGVTLLILAFVAAVLLLSGCQSASAQEAGPPPDDSAITLPTPEMVKAYCDHLRELGAVESAKPKLGEFEVEGRTVTVPMLDDVVGEQSPRYVIQVTSWGGLQLMEFRPQRFPGDMLCVESAKLLKPADELARRFASGIFLEMRQGEAPPNMVLAQLIAEDAWKTSSEAKGPRAHVELRSMNPPIGAHVECAFLKINGVATLKVVGFKTGYCN